MPKKTLIKLRHLCSSGLPAMTLMPLIAKNIHELVSYLSFSFIYVDDKDCRPLQYYAEHFDDKTHDLFCQSGARLVSADNDPASFKLLFSLPSTYGNLLSPPDVFYDSLNYQQFFKPNGIYHVMDMQFSDNGKPIALSGIFREHGKKAKFAQHEQRLLPMIHDYLQHLALAPNTFNKPSDTPITLLSAQEEASCSMIINNQGKLLMASPEAVDLLKTGVTACQRHALDKQDMSDIFQTLSYKVKKGTTQLPIIRIPIPGGVLVLRAYRLDNLTAGSDIQQPDMTTIHISKQVPVAYKVWGNLMKLKLTAQEQRVAWLLCQEKDSTTIERQLGIKTSTYRTYVKNLLGQCQVNSQTELVNMLRH